MKTFTTAMKQNSAEATIAVVEAQLYRLVLSLRRVMSRKKRERLQKYQHGRETEVIL